MSFWTKNIEAVRIDPNQNVGFGLTAPKSRVHSAGGIQCGDDTAAASADKVGTIRQRDVNNNTLLEFCKNTAGVYEWEKINDKLSLDQTTPQTLIASPKIASLTAGQLVYVNADKQLIPVDSVIWDDTKKQLQLSRATDASNVGLSVSKHITTGSYLYTNDGNAVFQSAHIKTITNAVFEITNTSVGAYSAMSFGTKNIEAVRIAPNQNVGFGLTDPKSRVHSAGGIQCGDDTAVASADKVGTTRYRATANASYVEMCMQVGASSYSWVAIVTNTW